MYMWYEVKCIITTDCCYTLLCSITSNLVKNFNKFMHIKLKFNYYGQWITTITIEAVSVECIYVLWNLKPNLNSLQFNYTEMTRTLCGCIIFQLKIFLKSCIPPHSYSSLISSHFISSYRVESSAFISFFILHNFINLNRATSVSCSYPSQKLTQKLYRPLIKNKMNWMKEWEKNNKNI